MAGTSSFAIKGRARGAAAFVLVSALSLAVPGAAQGPAAAAAQGATGEPVAAPASRWIASSVDESVDLHVAAARAAGPDALARLVLAASLHSVAEAHHVVRLLSDFHSASASLDDQAHWLARTLMPQTGRPHGLAALTRPLTSARGALGLVRAFAVLGPFEDTGGGLDRLEGPELPSHRYDSADYSWGAYQVRYRTSVPGLVSAHGIDLDLYVQPRKETCSYLESAVRFPVDDARWATSAAPPQVLLHVASSGAFRVSWDGALVALSGESHPDLRLDRAAARVSAGDRAHQLRIKVCTGAIMGSGRLRVRFTDEQYRPLLVESVADPDQLAAAEAEVRRAPVDAGPGAPEPSGRAPVAPPAAVATPLDQGLRAAEKPDSSAWLAAAVLRTLGAADDLQSPRAPGLLDAVVASSGLRPEVLAVAGWCSPSISNRTGWLERASDEARTVGDVATLGFAQRMLVESRLLAGQVDLARATLREASLASADDPHVRLLRARVLAAGGGPGFAASALAQLMSVTAQQGDRTPFAVWNAVASLSEGGSPQLHLEALGRLRTLDPDASGARWVRALAPFDSQRATDAALEQLGRVRSNREITTLARLLRDLGRYDEARAVYRAAANLAPNASTAVMGLARSELEASEGAAARERAVVALGRARDLDPQRADLGAELDFRQDESGARGAPSAAEDLKYLVEPSLFLARAKRSPALPGAQFERVLHWRRVVRLHPDKRVSQLMHWAREIVVEPRTEAERYEDLWVGSPHVELVLARVHRRDGTVVGPEEQETPSAGVPTIRWPKLERGDVVEVAVRGWTAGPVNRRGDVPFYFVDYVGSLDTRPVLYNEVVIDAPEGGPLAFDVLHGKPDRTEQERRGGRLVTRLVWDAPPTVHDEPLAPPPSELLPVVVGSSYPSWEVFTAWYQGAVGGFTEPDEQIERLAAELTRPSAGRELTRSQKIQALFEFVADDIRYVNYVSGEWWLPNRPQQLLARRQGDCDDKAMLLISLLRAVGVDAVEALVQTRHTGQPSVLQDARVAIPLFDHGIVYVPPAGKEPGQWLDATSPESRLGVLPAMDLGAAVLLVGPRAASPSGEPAAAAASGSGGARVMRTPTGHAADHGVDAYWTLELEPSGDGAIIARERHVGDAGLLLRMNLRQPDARAPWVEQTLLGEWFSSVQLDPDVGFEGDRPGGAAEVTFRGHSESIARAEGADRVVTLAPRMPLTAGLAPLPQRTLPVVLPPSIAPRHHRLEVRIEAPRSHSFAELPPDVVEDGGSFGRAALSFVRSTERGRSGGEVVILRREVSFEQTRIELAQYPAWRRWLQRIDAMVQRGVRLTPR